MADNSSNSNKPGAAAASSSAAPMPLKKRPLSNAAPAPRPAVRPRADEVRDHGLFLPSEHFAQERLTSGRPRDGKNERERERESRFFFLGVSWSRSVLTSSCSPFVLLPTSLASLFFLPQARVAGRPVKTMAGREDVVQIKWVFFLCGREERESGACAFFYSFVFLGNR